MTQNKKLTDRLFVLEERADIINRLYHGEQDTKRLKRLNWVSHFTKKKINHIKNILSIH